MGLSPGYGLKLVTPPTWEPVVPADLEAHSRILTTDLDVGTVTGFLLAAREYVETAARRAIAQQQWLMSVDQFPGRQVDDARPPTWRYGIFRLPMPPLISVDLVQYVDPSISMQAQPFPLTTLAPSFYQYDAYSEPGRLAPSPYNVWPATSPLAMQAVQVTFTCGWAAVNLVPQRIKQAILMLAAHLYEHRETTTEVALTKIPWGIQQWISSCSAKEYD
jgi:uncharacterized phiE125 gp8 family phage protein